MSQKRILFYNQKDVMTGYLSNFYSSPTFQLTIDNVEYLTSEHYYQAKKIDPKTTYAKEYISMIIIF